MNDHSDHDTEQLRIKGMEVVNFSNLLLLFTTQRKDGLQADAGVRKHHTLPRGAVSLSLHLFPS